MGAIAPVTLLTSASETGPWVRVVSGKRMPVVSGDPSGATVGLELSLDGENAVDTIDDVTFTAPGILPSFEIGSCYLRGTITGGSSPSVSFVLLGVE
jgi:hypothetical protein